MEVTNRLKRLDLIQCLKNYGNRFMILYRKQGSKPSPIKEMQKGKMVVSGGLTNICEKNRSERKWRKGKIYPFDSRVPKYNKAR